MECDHSEKNDIHTYGAPSNITPLENSGIYIGGGLALGAAFSDAYRDSGGVSEGTLTGFGITAGKRYDAQGFFYGGELDADINLIGEMEQNGVSCSDGFASGPYYCSQAATIRLRAVAGTDIGPVEVFGTLGYAFMFGQGALGLDGKSDYGINGGLTLGVGIQRQIGQGVFRIEYIRDNLTNNLVSPEAMYAPTWSANSAKISYLWAF